MMLKIFHSILLLFPPELAHDISRQCLKVFHKLGLLSQKKMGLETKPIKVKNLTFKNPVGLAAGFDKKGDLIEVLEKFDFGFIEVGTFTPQPQIGNTKPRLFRLPKLNALINRMGINNPGLDKAAENIQQQSHTTILGINVGKGRQSTELQAVGDYLQGMEKMFAVADYLAINISCPNIPDPSMFWAGPSMANLLEQIKQKQDYLQSRYQKQVPVFIKISPDLSEKDLKAFCELMNHYHLDGVIAGNTTVTRPENANDKHLHEKGGLSGEPLFENTLRIVKILKQCLHEDIAIIAVGGINSHEKIQQCLNAGAKLIQVYTAWVLEPDFFSQLYKR